jgi:hypothetical protein
MIIMMMTIITIITIKTMMMMMIIIPINLFNDTLSSFPFIEKSKGWLVSKSSK